MPESSPDGSGQDIRDVNDSIEFADWALDALEDRVSAIEEIIAARWPRSMFLRRRLARELRASVRACAWAGSGFATRRAEWAGEHVAWDSVQRPG